jgi:hypothetical protein
MADGLTEKRSGWRKPVLAGVAGVMFFVAGFFSRLTNPPSPLLLTASSGGLGLLGLWFYLRSDARDREERMTGSLGEIARQRLRKQRPMSIGLAIALIGLIAVPGGLFFFARWIDPVFYNGVIGFCLIGMFLWCVAAAIGHSARHRVLDEHERTLENAYAKVRQPPSEA